MEKKLSAEEVITKDQAYQEATFQSLAKNPNGTRQEIIWLAMDIYASQFKGEAVSDAVEFVKWISDNQFTRRNYFWKSTQKRYFGVDYTTEELYQQFKKTKQ